MGLKDRLTRQVQKAGIPAPNLQSRIPRPIGSDSGTFFSPPIGSLLQPIEPALEPTTKDSED